jgi:peptide/nickel transport system ATP-binding protein
MIAVSVSGLRVELGASGADIVDHISFTIEAGEVLGVVGESGSGKTTVAAALLGHARGGARIAGGSVLIDGVDVLALGPKELRDARGKVVAYIPQEPSAALSPNLRIGRQIEELLETHDVCDGPEARRERIGAALEEVGLPTDEEFLRRYPHQLSGGQQQRVAIAMAFACRPKVLVFDEPTTGLDVVTQGQVLRTIRTLCRTHGVAALYVTHDLAVVTGLADRVLVLYAGRMVELGSRDAVFDRTSHPYTNRLLGAVPSPHVRRALTTIPGLAPAPGERPQGCFFAPRCALATDECRTAEPPEVIAGPRHVSRCFRVADAQAESVRDTTVGPREALARSEPVLTVRDLEAGYGSKQVLHGVSLELYPRECLAIVGESGSGKTTLSRAIIGLAKATAGEVTFKGRPLESNARRRPAAVRLALQYIFQSPYNSLNPRKTIGESVALPLRQLDGLGGRRAARARVHEALEHVSLPARVADCFPDELSGGERQRAAIARALVCKPEIIICDEITSALDVSVQASIVQLLERLQAEEELAMLFVTHNLALVRSIADRVCVLHEGRIVEAGDVEKTLQEPTADYTRRLLAEAPAISAPAAPLPR